MVQYHTIKEAKFLFFKVLVRVCDPLVVLDLPLHLSSLVGETLREIVHRGILGEANVLESLELLLQVGQLRLGCVRR